MAGASSIGLDAESSQTTTSSVRKKRKGPANAVAGSSTSHSEEHKGIPSLRGRRKLGLLAGLPNLPLDILFEILGHLDPYDVLKLARTTKDFRSLLLKRSSSSIWKAAFSNIPDLPDCPPGMSEPAWAALVFSPRCSFCFTTSVRKVQWMFRIRICSKCIKEHLESRHAIYAKEGYNMEFLIPTSLGQRGVKIYLKSDYKRVEDEYAALATAEARRLYVEERTNAVRAITQHAKLCELWARGQTIDRDQQLQRLREDRLAAITQKLEDLGWAEDIAGIHSPDSLASHKLVDRPQLLTERIWKNIKPGILEFMEEMREKRFKREFVALVNDRKRSAVTVLRTIKNARLPETEIMPQGPDFCHFPAISEVLNQAADVEVDVSSFDDIIPLLPVLITEWRDSIKRKMMQVVKKHNTSRGNSYLDFMFGMGRSMYECDYDYDCDYDCETPPPIGPNSHLTDEELSRKLTLASTVFTCSCGDGYSDYPNFYDYDSDGEDDYSSASKVLFYPQVMGHSCLSRVSKMFLWELSSSNDPSCRLESSSRSERKQWDSTGLSLLTAAGRTAQHIIQLAGLDPDFATSTEMDQLELRFKCRACVMIVPPESEDGEDDDDYDSVFPIFDWRGAIIHQTNGHRTNAVDSVLEIISEDDLTEDIKEAESKHWAEFDSIWLCTHCRDLPREAKPDTLDGVKQHISRIHHIESPILNEDYFQDFAARDMRESHPYFYVRYNDGSFSPYHKQLAALFGMIEGRKAVST